MATHADLNKARISQWIADQNELLLGDAELDTGELLPELPVRTTSLAWAGIPAMDSAMSNDIPLVSTSGSRNDLP